MTNAGIKNIAEVARLESNTRRVGILANSATWLTIAIAMSLATGAFAQEKKAVQANGPLLIAELPAKPAAKKFDLRYKLSRGEVLRY
ncbi:MAG TPA: hypothetical protein VFW73_11815, partial [Lacipirellulaceae bacterium]|nr:hypothetical protein [Lacipirellulaceae bacterium]